MLNKVQMIFYFKHSSQIAELKKLKLLRKTKSGQNCLDAGKTTLVNSKQCKMAAGHFGDKYSGILNNGDIAKGCILVVSSGDQAVYWNEGGKKAVHMDSYNAICYGSKYAIRHSIEIYSMLSGNNC